MSGYFGALMRASGLAIAGGPPAITREQPRPFEIDVERAAASARTAGAMRPPPTLPFTKPVEHPAASEPGARSRGERTDVATDRVSPHAESDVATSPLTRPKSPVQTPTPVTGLATIDAALRWIAADASRLGDGATVMRPVAPWPETSLPVCPDLPGVTTPAQTRFERDVFLDPPAPNAAPAPFASDLIVRSPVAVQAPPMPLARLIPAALAPAAQAAPPVRDELAEVSIGAIHLRVDAPVPQTVAGPAAAPPPAHRAPAPPPRSALARRALRRI